MTERRMAFEARMASKVQSGLEALSAAERLAIRLGRLKAERGATNRQLAEELGVSEPYISQLTRGRRDVKLTTLDKMAKTWGITPPDLFVVTKEDLEWVTAALSRRNRRKSSPEMP